MPPLNLAAASALVRYLKTAKPPQPVRPEGCKQCVSLCSHALKKEGAPEVHVQLHQEYQSRDHHMLVSYSDGPSIHVGIGLQGKTTEFVADFYISFVKSLAAGCGYQLTRTQMAAKDAPVVLTGKKGDTSIDLLGLYFHFPVTEASKVLDICNTSLKKICRKYGLVRWPYRKVKSIDQRAERAVTYSIHDKKWPGNRRQLPRSRLPARVRRALQA